MSFTVAIAGRPNVGKSTLFNRLIGRSMAIVSDESGVTRDWREGEAKLFDLKFRVLDTAGLEGSRTKGSLPERLAQQTKQALDQTHVILFVVDARTSLTSEDKAVAREIRKTGKPVILLANKCESSHLPEGFDEFTSLGFGEAIPISATHGDGMMDVYGLLSERMQGVEEQEAIQNNADDEKNLNVAIVGRPNAGKSTLVNHLIGEDRMLTGPEPGLTRDSIAIGWQYNEQPVRLVDTAGMRRRTKISEKLEKTSVQESLRAIRLAHVVVLVIDATGKIDKQDLTIAQHVVEEGRALVIALNKWDAVKEKRETLDYVKGRVGDSLSQVSGVPVVTLSAMKGDGLERLMDTVLRIYDVWNTRVSTNKLNNWLEDMEANHPPPITSGRRIKLRYMTQIKSRPPTFALWVNKPINLPDSYQRFLTNGLRELFKLQGVPIRWILKKSENPYEDKRNKD